MLCPKCNNEINNNRKCPYCGYDINMENDRDKVQTMSGREARNFDGITIEEENNFAQENTHSYRQSSYQNQQRNYQQRGSYYTNRNHSGVKVRYINLGGLGKSSSSNWLMRGLFALGGLAILGFIFFVALPALLTIVGVGIIAWIIFKIFKR